MVRPPKLIEKEARFEIEGGSGSLITCAICRRIIGKIVAWKRAAVRGEIVARQRHLKSIKIEEKKTLLITASI